MRLKSTLRRARPVSYAVENRTLLKFISLYPSV